MHRSKPIEKLGMHCSDTAELYFDSVRVPKKYIIGEEGRGFVYQMEQFQDERLVATAVCTQIFFRFISEILYEFVKIINVQANINKIFGLFFCCKVLIKFLHFTHINLKYFHTSMN